MRSHCFPGSKIFLPTVSQSPPHCTRISRTPKTAFPQKAGRRSSCQISRVCTRVCLMNTVHIVCPDHFICRKADRTATTQASRRGQRTLGETVRDLAFPGSSAQSGPGASLIGNNIPYGTNGTLQTKISGPLPKSQPDASVAAHIS